MRVAQVGHAANRARFTREKRRRQDGQGRILRAADLDRTAQRTPTVDPNLIHNWLGEIELFLNNPFSTRCPDNSLDAKIRSILQPD